MQRDFVTYPGVLDKSQLPKDLRDLRDSLGLSQRDFAEKAGIDWGKIQRIEGGQSLIDIADFAACLDAAGTSLMKYLNQQAIAEHLKALQEDWELAEIFVWALKIPAKREMLTPILRGMYAEAKRSDKNRKRRPE